MIHRHYYLFLALLVAAHVTGCHSSKPVAEERPGLLYASRSVGVDSLRDTISAPPPRPLPQGEGLVKPGILSGIGKVFSTPEGIARRQAVRLAKASAPKIGKKAQGTIITGNGNNEVKQAQAGKNAGPATNADSGAVVTNTDIDKNKGPVAAGPHASATQTIEKPGFWAVMGAAALRLWWLWLLILLFIFRKRLPVVGAFFT